MNLEELVKMIDHTSIWPRASFSDIKKLCNEAIEYRFGCVCVNPFYVAYTIKLLKNTDIKISSTCGFPFGANRTDVKVYEAEKAIYDGAREIDMVMNIGALKSKEYKIVENDIKGVVNVCKKNNVLCKVILEMGLLTQKEKVFASRISCELGVSFIKTGTGLWGPAKLTDVKLMKKIAGNKTGVKASGGIRTFKQAESFIKTGATRIGTSTGIAIIKDYLKHDSERRSKKNPNIREAY